MTEQVVGGARSASEAALSKIKDALESKRSFVVEAGAGAGKTYSLVESLQYLIERRRGQSWPAHQRVACITYTNVAKDEIERRIDDHPLVFCSTIHGFCWEAMKQFQGPLRSELPQLPRSRWRERAEKKGIPIAQQPVSYALGLPTITADQITLGHADVPNLMVQLLDRPRFRALLADRFPYILVDEYQDSDKGLMRALTTHFVESVDEGSAEVNPTSPPRPVLGFFGDHWQQIYPGTCGAIKSDALLRIEKGANFRSTTAVIDLLNRMRPELPQSPDRSAAGEIAVFHTNGWTVPRQTDAQWRGDLDREGARLALQEVVESLDSRPLDDSQRDLKILMLTHRVLGAQQRYSNLVDSFSNIDGLSTLEDKHLAYFVRVLEPVCAAYRNRRYAEMFDHIEAGTPLIGGAGDKQRWNEGMSRLLEVRDEGTVDDVLKLLRQTKCPPLTDAIEQREEDVVDGRDTRGSTSRLSADLVRLKTVRYAEVARFAEFHAKNSAFATKHGVKGEEFEDVLVVTSRGWANYDFNAMLELVPDEANLSDRDRERLRRYRNLFYVACSRARTRLTVLFTHELSDAALSTLVDWFGYENVHALEQPDRASHRLPYGR